MRPPNSVTRLIRSPSRRWLMVPVFFPVFAPEPLVVFLRSSQLARIRVHGFSAREVATVRRLYLADLERAYIERDQALSDSLRAEYVQVSRRPLDQEAKNSAAPRKVSFPGRTDAAAKPCHVWIVVRGEAAGFLLQSCPLATSVLLSPVETKASSKAGETGAAFVRELTRASSIQASLCPKDGIYPHNLCTCASSLLTAAIVWPVLQHFLTGEPVPGIVYEARLAKTLLPEITAEDMQKVAHAYGTQNSCVIKTVSCKRVWTITCLLVFVARKTFVLCLTHS
jgi:hypothetical protein